MTGHTGTADERVAAFDLGSNTARGLLAHPREDGAAEVLMGAQCMTALGRGLSQTGRLDPDGLASTVSFVSRVLAEWQRPARVFAVATAAARDAANGEELLARLHEGTGVRAEIIGGDEEGRLSFRGALAMAPLLAERSPAVIDVGGRSTELVVEQGEGLQATSVPVGARSLTELCLRSDPPTSTEMAQMRRVAHGALGSALAVLTDQPVVAVGGSAQAVMLLARGARAVRLRDLTRLARRLCSVPLAQRRALMPFDPERAEVICGGLALLEVIAAHAPGTLLHISEGGVREGLLLERTGATRLVARG